MKIYDVDEPKEQFVEIDGCSAMGKLDKFGHRKCYELCKKICFSKCT